MEYRHGNISKKGLSGVRLNDNRCNTTLTFNAIGLQKTLGPRDFGFRPDNADDEVTKYDSRSDEEETETDVSELDRGSTFLLGTTTRLGRRINSRLIL